MSSYNVFGKDDRAHHTPGKIFKTENILAKLMDHLNNTVSECITQKHIKCNALLKAQTSQDYGNNVRQTVRILARTC